MNEMRELVDAGQVGIAVAALSGLALVAAAVLLATSRGKIGARRLGLIAAALVPAWPLWLIYNAIEDHFGLESVAALLINLALFAAVGIGIGLALRRLWPTDPAEATSLSSEPTPESA
jgi:hypothetical protein